MPMTINGNGSIGGLSAGGLPDATVQQADLAPNVAGNGPAFSVYQNAAQAVATGAGAKLLLQAKEFDTHNAFDTTNSRFQPLVAGYYHLNGVAMLAITTGNISTSINKNGVTAKVGNVSTSDGANAYSVVTALVYLNGTTDYVDINVTNRSGAQANTVAGSAWTFLQGFLARAA